MRRYRNALCAAALLAPAAHAQEAPPSQAPAETPSGPLHPFRFRWPVPSEATVTETTEDEVAGTKKTVSYRIFLEKAVEGHGLRLRIDGVALVPDPAAAPQPMGAAAPDPAWVEKLRPNLRIWDEGECLGTLDYEKALERFLGGVPKDERDFQRAFLERNPAIRLEAENEMTRFWTDWVERWNGMTLAEAGTVARDLTEVFPDGKRMRLAGSVRHHGVPDDERRLVELSYECALSGREALLAAVAAAAEGGAGVAPPASSPTEERAQARRSVHVRAVLERATLRPVHVVSERRGRGKLGDGSAEEFALRREWTFAWQGSEPARPKR